MVLGLQQLKLAAGILAGLAKAGDQAGIATAIDLALKATDFGETLRKQDRVAVALRDVSAKLEEETRKALSGEFGADWESKPDLAATLAALPHALECYAPDTDAIFVENLGAERIARRAAADAAHDDLFRRNTVGERLLFAVVRQTYAVALANKDFALQMILRGQGETLNRLDETLQQARATAAREQLALADLLQGQDELAEASKRRHQEMLDAIDAIRGQPHTLEMMFWIPADSSRIVGFSNFRLLIPPRRESGLRGSRLRDVAEALISGVNALGDTTISSILDCNRIEKFFEQCENLIHTVTSSDDQCAAKALPIVEVSLGIINFLRFAKEWPGLGADDINRLKSYSDALIGASIRIEPRDIERAENLRESEIRLAGEFLHRIGYQEKALTMRYGTTKGSTHLAEVEDMIRRWPTKIVETPGSQIHAELQSYIGSELQIGDFRDFGARSREIDRAISGLIERRGNEVTQEFLSFSAVPFAQANFDLSTVLARLFEFKAKHRIADSLSQKRRISGEAKKTIVHLLEQADSAFRGTSGGQVWWHGYANYVVTLAVFAYSQDDLPAFRHLLEDAARLFVKTNDRSRADDIRMIADRAWSRYPVYLSDHEIAKLLFAE